MINATLSNACNTKKAQSYHIIPNRCISLNSFSTLISTEYAHTIKSININYQKSLKCLTDSYEAVPRFLDESISNKITKAGHTLNLKAQQLFEGMATAFKGMHAQAIALLKHKIQYISSQFNSLCLAVQNSYKLLTNLIERLISNLRNEFNT